MLSVECLRENEFTARLEDFWGQALGADVLARAVRAAAATCPGNEPHSLQACFVRPAPAGEPLRLRVEPLGGDELLQRRQVRLEGDCLLCQVVTTFAAPGEGFGYQDFAPASGLPRPEDLRSTLETAQAEGWADYARGPIEFRRVMPRVWPDPSAAASGIHVEWMRPRQPLPDDAVVHMAALAFLGGFYTHWAFEHRAGRGFAYDRFRDLDHTLWVHRRPRWDDWWLLEARTSVSHAGRALGRRRIYTRDGSLLASSGHTALVARA
jgi:acyl-CoA thioesterase-2